MTDRNTISRVIESLFEDWIDKNINVHPLAVENMRILEADALAMLKEREAVKPVLDEQTGRIWLCGKCGSYVGFEDNDPHDPNEFDRFCRDCGTPVVWEGR